QPAVPRHAHVEVADCHRDVGDSRETTHGTVLSLYGSSPGDPGRRRLRRRLRGGRAPLALLYRIADVQVTAPAGVRLCHGDSDPGTLRWGSSVSWYADDGTGGPAITGSSDRPRSTSPSPCCQCSCSTGTASCS